MTELTTEGRQWRSDIKQCIALSEAKSKDPTKILMFLRKQGFVAKTGHEMYIPKTVHKLKTMDYIKETKDAYVLTEKGKKEVEEYKNLPPYLLNG